MNLQEKINKLYEQNIYDFYVWLTDSEYWQEISSLTEKDLQEDESNFSLIQVELLLNDSYGQYIPQKFYQNFDLKQWNINQNKYTDLNDPDSEIYWDSWNDLLSNAYCELNGQKWYLYQDGDLWAIHYL